MQLPLKLILGVVGNATAMALFLSPMPTFIRIFKMKSTEDYSGLPYVCTLFNCVMWILYGMPFVKPNSVLIVTINGSGMVLEIVYLVLFMAFGTRTSKIQITRCLIGVITIYFAVIFTTLFAIHSLSSRQLLVGSLCVVMGTAMYASPLSIMGMVIRTRSVEYMPFALSLCNFLNSAVWTAYSLVTKDIFVGIPNGIGCISGVVQFVLYAIYKNAEPAKVAEVVVEKETGLKGGVYTSMEKSSQEKKLQTTTTKLSNPHTITHPTSRPLSNCDVLAAQV